MDRINGGGGYGGDYVIGGEPAAEVEAEQAEAGDAAHAHRAVRQPVPVRQDEAYDLAGAQGRHREEHPD